MPERAGRVTIRYTYENNQYEYVEIDGQQEKIYVPFAMLTGLLLDSDHFRNVEVTNGKMLGDGDKMAVIGIAFPGLKSNLDIDSDEIDIPDYVEISADVNEFSLTNTVTIATNEVFNAVEHKQNGQSIRRSLIPRSGQLTDAVSQLLRHGSSRFTTDFAHCLKNPASLWTESISLRQALHSLRTAQQALITVQAPFRAAFPHFPRDFLKLPQTTIP